MEPNTKDLVTFVRAQLEIGNKDATYLVIKNQCLDMFTAEYVEKHSEIISKLLESHAILKHPTTDLSSTNFTSGCMVCDDVIVRGRVTFGSGTIVQPCSRFLATGTGAIIVGSDNIFEEQCVVINDSDEDMIIGSLNLFEVGCTIRASSIGNGNQIGVRASLGFDVIMGDHGLVVAMQTVENGTVLADHCLVTPSVSNVADRGDNVVMHQQYMIDCLNALRNPSSKTCLLNFHKMHKIKKRSPRNRR